jgi:hypothetical protein
VNVAPSHPHSVSATPKQRIELQRPMAGEHPGSNKQEPRPQSCSVVHSSEGGVASLSAQKHASSGALIGAQMQKPAPSSLAQGTVGAQRRPLASVQ